MLELGAGSTPLPVLVVDIDGLVHKTHTIVSGLVLEGVAVLLAEFHDLLDDLGGSPRNLDRVGLDVCNVEALLLDEVLQIHHEQCTTLGDNVVHIAGVLEGVGKLCRSETVHRVDNDLESEGQCLIVDSLLEERLKGSVQKRPS